MPTMVHEAAADSSDRRAPKSPEPNASVPPQRMQVFGANVFAGFSSPLLSTLEGRYAESIARELNVKLQEALAAKRQVRAHCCWPNPQPQSFPPLDVVAVFSRPSGTHVST